MFWRKEKCAEQQRANAYIRENRKSQERPRQRGMRVKDTLALRTAVFALLAEAPKQPANHTAKECEHQDPETELEWLAELRNPLTPAAIWT